jgi:hypothetical protein
MNNELQESDKKKAYEYGISARKKGKKSIPSVDREFTKFYLTNFKGAIESLELLKQWHNGYMYQLKMEEQNEKSIFSL